MEKIAVLLTCFNRKDKTLLCLRSLFRAIDEMPSKINFDIFLVDDGSTDGTFEEVKKQFPLINIIKGTGNLFWAGGMILAWDTAISTKNNYEAYILLNDDVILKKDFIIKLLQTHEYCVKNRNRPGIYVCSTADPVDFKITYGGQLIVKKGIRFRSVRVTPSDIPLPCSIANANILMITRGVVETIGIFDRRYTHLIADYDYTLTATNKGIPVLVCPGIGGYCIKDHGNSWMPQHTSLKERIKFLYSPKGLTYREQLYYLRKHFKFQLPYYFVLLWLKTIFPFIWDKFKKDIN